MRLRNSLLSRPLFLNGMLKLGERVSSTVTLPDHPAADRGRMPAGDGA
ncbi:hypothetical protein ACIBBB_28275 [Streptomyces sp. NPDC051217]